MSMRTPDELHAWEEGLKAIETFDWWKPEEFDQQYNIQDYELKKLEGGSNAESRDDMIIGETEQGRELQVPYEQQGRFQNTQHPDNGQMHHAPSLSEPSCTHDLIAAPALLSPSSCPLDSVLIQDKTPKGLGNRDNGESGAMSIDGPKHINIDTEKSDNASYPRPSQIDEADSRKHLLVKEGPNSLDVDHSTPAKKKIKVANEATPCADTVTNGLADGQDDASKSPAEDDGYCSPDLVEDGYDDRQQSVENDDEADKQLRLEHSLSMFSALPRARLGSTSDMELDSGYEAVNESRLFVKQLDEGGMEEQYCDMESPFPSPLERSPTPAALKKQQESTVYKRELRTRRGSSSCRQLKPKHKGKESTAVRQSRSSFFVPQPSDGDVAEKDASDASFELAGARDKSKTPLATRFKLNAVQIPANAPLPAIESWHEGGASHRPRSAGLIKNESIASRTRHALNLNYNKRPRRGDAKATTQSPFASSRIGNSTGMTEAHRDKTSEDTADASPDMIVVAQAKPKTKSKKTKEPKSTKSPRPTVTDAKNTGKRRETLREHDKQPDRMKTRRISMQEERDRNVKMRLRRSAGTI